MSSSLQQLLFSHLLLTCLNWSIEQSISKHLYEHHATQLLWISVKGTALLVNESFYNMFFLRAVFMGWWGGWRGMFHPKRHCGFTIEKCKNMKEKPFCLRHGDVHSITEKSCSVWRCCLYIMWSSNHSSYFVNCLQWMMYPWESSLTRKSGKAAECAKVAFNRLTALT